jgi:nucleoside-diphosphate-sugar epimerase
MNALLPCAVDEIDAFLSRPARGVVESLERHVGDVLVAGAGGKMGTTLALMLRQAVGDSRRVMAASRFSNPAVAHGLREAGIEVHPVDLVDPHAVAALPDAPVVFFLAGQKFGTADAPEMTWAMNTVVPAVVAERYRGSRFVAFSTGCVYELTTPESGGSTEDGRTAPPGEYAQSCLGREGVFRFFAPRHQSPTALVRLNYACEFRYGVLIDLAERVLRGEPIDLTVGHVNLIWQRDACAHAIQCLDLAAIPGRPVNVTGAEVLSIRALAEALGDRLGRAPTFVGEPSGTAWLNNAAMSHAAFGRPETSLAEMLDWTAAWLLAGGATLRKPTHFESVSGKF